MRAVTKKSPPLLMTAPAAFVSVGGEGIVVRLVLRLLVLVPYVEVLVLVMVE
jgi:hypothetical protein